MKKLPTAALILVLISIFYTADIGIDTYLYTADIGIDEVYS